MYGVSDHDLLFSKEAEPTEDHELVEGDPKNIETRVCQQNCIQCVCVTCNLVVSKTVYFCQHTDFLSLQAELAERMLNQESETNEAWVEEVGYYPAPEVFKEAGGPKRTLPTSKQLFSNQEPHILFRLFFVESQLKLKCD